MLTKVLHREDDNYSEKKHYKEIIKNKEILEWESVIMDTILDTII